MKKLVLIFLLLPFVLIAQKQASWQLFVNNKLNNKGIANNVKIITVKKELSNTLKVKFFSTHKKDWKTELIIMDTNRIELNKEKMNFNSALINKKYFVDENGKQRSIVVYVIETPKNAKLAATIRVKPVPLFQLNLN